MHQVGIWVANYLGPSIVTRKKGEMCTSTSQTPFRNLGSSVNSDLGGIRKSGRLENPFKVHFLKFWIEWGVVELIPWQFFIALYVPTGMINPPSLLAHCQVTKGQEIQTFTDSGTKKPTVAFDTPWVFWISFQKSFNAFHPDLHADLLYLFTSEWCAVSYHSETEGELLWDMITHF